MASQSHADSSGESLKMGFLLYSICVCVADYLYFKLKYTKPKGPPTWYFFPFLGVLPIVFLPKFLFAPLYAFYVRNFPDVIITRFIGPCVLVKNEAVQDVQNSEYCLSRPGPGLDKWIAYMATGKPSWFVADHNAKECDWRSVRKTNLMAFNVLPKEQKFGKTAEIADHFLKSIDDHEGHLWHYEADISYAKMRETSYLNLGVTFEENRIETLTEAIKIIGKYMRFLVVISSVIPPSLLTMVEPVLPTMFRPSVFRKMYTLLCSRLLDWRTREINEPQNFVEAVRHIKERNAALEFIMETLIFNMIASTHTTQHTVAAALSFVSLDRRVQKKIHEELDRVVGAAPLNQGHLADLHYLNAAILEASRTSPPIPTILRWTTAPAKVGGYTVDSNMSVCMFLQSECMDSRKFPNPDDYVPERHINDEGKFESSKHFSIFSRGKRRCTGIDIAGLSTQVYCAKILQHFEIFPERPDVEVPKYSGTVFMDSPLIPLRFVRRPGSPEIQPVAVETGLMAFVEKVLREGKAM